MITIIDAKKQYSKVSDVRGINALTWSFAPLSWWLELPDAIVKINKQIKFMDMEIKEFKYEGGNTIHSSIPNLDITLF